MCPAATIRTRNQQVGSAVTFVGRNSRRSRRIFFVMSETRTSQLRTSEMKTEVCTYSSEAEQHLDNALHFLLKIFRERRQFLAVCFVFCLRRFCLDWARPRGVSNTSAMISILSAADRHFRSCKTRTGKQTGWIEPTFASSIASSDSPLAESARAIQSESFSTFFTCNSCSSTRFLRLAFRWHSESASVRESSATGNFAHSRSFWLRRSRHA